jgi:signal peptidase I
LTAATLKRLWKNEYFKTAITVVIIIAIVFGFWFSSQWILNTPYPALAVASGSMCQVHHMNCDGWSHPFARTLHVGDLIIVQGIEPEDIMAEPYPYGDIIVFHRPGVSSQGDLIVHRAIGKTINNETRFTTKGDGNTSPDSWEVPEASVVGKVVFRIPWIGHVALFMRESHGIFVMIILIAILVIVEFIFPVFSSKESKETAPEKDMEKPFEAKAL